MIKPFNNQIITLFFISLLFISSSCFAVSFFDDDEDIIWETGFNLYFKYAKQDTSKYGKNDHPVELDAKRISTALKALKFLDKDFISGETISPVFSASQINLLSKQLSKGLINAKPGQDIIFVLAGSSRKLIVLKRKSFTTGRAFYKEGKLNIILGDYDLTRNDAFEAAVDPAGSGIINYSFNFGKRSKSSRALSKVTLVNAPGIENKNLRKLRQDWFVIDVELAAESYLARKYEKENPVTRQDEQSKIQAAIAAKERRQLRAEIARMRKEQKESSSVKSAEKTVKERLNELKELLDDELITQEFYDSKRKDILNDI